MQRPRLLLTAEPIRIVEDDKDRRRPEMTQRIFFTYFFPGTYPPQPFFVCLCGQLTGED